MVKGKTGNTGSDTSSEFNPEKGSGSETNVPATGESGFTPEETLIHELSHASEKNVRTIEPFGPNKRRADKDNNGYEDTEDRAVAAQNDYSDAAKTGHHRTDYGDTVPCP